jgi:adenine-specific DNA-methyltransferase
MHKKSEQDLEKEIARLKRKLKETKKYGLVWDEEKNPEEVVEMCKGELPVLKEVKNKEIITDKNKPINLLIEGDNYHALSVLNYIHVGKVDVIYIDPPYNTGNKDFIYNDHYVEREDAYRHSKWLSFMVKRLELAKNLLKDTGIIFISIDDNEMAQLKLLCDKVFGEDNFINNITVKSSESSGVKMSHVEKKLPKIKEYLIVYGRNALRVSLNPIKILKSANYEKFRDYSKYYSKIISNPNDAPEKWEILSLKQYFNKNKIKIYSSDDLVKFKLKNAERIVYRTNNKSFSDLKFKTKIAKVNSATGLEYIWWEGKQMLFLSDYIEESLCDLWSDISTINLNKEMAGLPSFSNGQKPVQLISRIIKLYPSNSATVLDFMAGSGTTGHAVLELNKEDGGTRKFILCTNNGDEKSEHKIAEDICYPRISKVIGGYKNIRGEKIVGLGGNLKYYKTDFVGAKPSDKNKIKLTRQATEMLCIKEDAFKLIHDGEDFKIFKNLNHYTGIIFDQSAISNFKKTIKNLNGKFSVYIFSLGDETFDDEFADVKQRVKLSPIPEAILKVYRRIFK